jgi:peptidoglycan/xylan/chitin deacetylase (PgdA/CDA1 family)
MHDQRFIDTIADYYPRSMRTRLRFGAVASLAALEKFTGRLDRGLARNRVHFIMLHSVFKDEERLFRELLRRLSVRHKFIEYSDAVRRVRSGNFPGPAVTFSFDDGMKNNVAASRILDEFGAKGCFFVCSDIVGETDFERLQTFCGSRLMGPPVEFMDWSDIEAVMDSGHEIGSHTKSHPNLAELAGDDIENELSGSLHDLRRRVGAVKHLAWPYGRFDTIPDGFGATAARIGYDSVASGVRGCHVAAAEGNAAALCIRRDHVIAGWPVEQSMYFLARSAASASIGDNLWPTRTPV